MIAPIPTSSLPSPPRSLSPWSMTEELRGDHHRRTQHLAAQACTIRHRMLAQLEAFRPTDRTLLDAFNMYVRVIRREFNMIELELLSSGEVKPVEPGEKPIRNATEGREGNPVSSQPPKVPDSPIEATRRSGMVDDISSVAPSESISARPSCGTRPPPHTNRVDWDDIVYQRSDPERTETSDSGSAGSDIRPSTPPSLNPRASTFSPTATAAPGPSRTPLPPFYTALGPSFAHILDGPFVPEAFRPRELPPRPSKHLPIVKPLEDDIISAKGAPNKTSDTDSRSVWRETHEGLASPNLVYGGPSDAEDMSGVNAPRAAATVGSPEGDLVKSGARPFFRGFAPHDEGRAIDEASHPGTPSYDDAAIPPSPVVSAVPSDDRRSSLRVRKSSLSLPSPHLSASGRQTVDDSDTDWVSETESEGAHSAHWPVRPMRPLPRRGNNTPDTASKPLPPVPMAPAPLRFRRARITPSPLPELFSSDSEHSDGIDAIMDEGVQPIPIPRRAPASLKDSLGSHVVSRRTIGNGATTPRGDRVVATQEKRQSGASPVPFAPRPPSENEWDLDVHAPRLAELVRRRDEKERSSSPSPKADNASAADSIMVHVVPGMGGLKEGLPDLDEAPLTVEALWKYQSGETMRISEEDDGEVDMGSVYERMDAGRATKSDAITSTEEGSCVLGDPNPEIWSRRTIIGKRSVTVGSSTPPDGEASTRVLTGTPPRPVHIPVTGVNADGPPARLIVHLTSEATSLQPPTVHCLPPGAQEIKMRLNADGSRPEPERRVYAYTAPPPPSINESAPPGETEMERLKRVFARMTQEIKSNREYVQQRRRLREQGYEVEDSTDSYCSHSDYEEDEGEGEEVEGWEGEDTGGGDGVGGGREDEGERASSVGSKAEDQSQADDAEAEGVDAGEDVGAVRGQLEHKCAGGQGEESGDAVVQPQ